MSWPEGGPKPDTLNGNCPEAKCLQGCLEFARDAYPVGAPSIATDDSERRETARVNENPECDARRRGLGAYVEAVILLRKPAISLLQRAAAHE